MSNLVVKSVYKCDVCNSILIKDSYADDYGYTNHPVCPFCGARETDMNIRKLDDLSYLGSELNNLAIGIHDLSDDKWVSIGKGN